MMRCICVSLTGTFLGMSLKRHLSNICYFIYLNKLIFQFQFFVYDFPNFCGRFAKKFLKHINVM